MFREIPRIGETSCETPQPSQPWPVSGGNLGRLATPSIRSCGSWRARRTPRCGSSASVLQGKWLSCQSVRFPHYPSPTRAPSGEIIAHPRKSAAIHATAVAIRGKGKTLTRADESYRKEHLSKFARGSEQWRILEREILPEIGGVLLADLKPSQVMAAIVPIRKSAPRVAAMGISALRGVIRHVRSMNGLDLDVADPTASVPTIPQGKHSRALSDPEIHRLLQTPEEFKVCSQNLGHDKVLTTFLSYGQVESHRQGEIIRSLATPHLLVQSDVSLLAKALAR